MHLRFIGSVSLPCLIFNIIYRSGKTNQATDALSQCPEPNCRLESDSDSNSDDPVMLSYATICDIIKLVLGDTKIPFNIKKKAQAASNLLEWEKSMPEFHAIPDLTTQTSAVSVFDQVPPANMAKAQHVKILCWDWSFHTSM